MAPAEVARIEDGRREFPESRERQTVVNGKMEHAGDCFVLFGSRRPESRSG